MEVGMEPSWSSWEVVISSSFSSSGNSPSSSSSSSSSSFIWVDDGEVVLEAAAGQSTPSPNFFPSSSTTATTHADDDQQQSRRRRRHFLEIRCYLCKKTISGEEDIFMYRGDVPFCSEDCRQKQIDMDEDLEDHRVISELFQSHFDDKLPLHHHKLEAKFELTDCSQDQPPSSILPQYFN